MEPVLTTVPTNVTTELFLRCFFQEGETVNFFIRQENGGDGRKDVPCTLTASWLNNILEKLGEHNRDGYGIYYVVNQGGTRDRDITRINAHYMEIDDIPLQEQWDKIMAFPFPPTVVVYSGGKSYHSYWLVKDAKVERFRDIQRGLVSYFNADASIINEARKMRVPGFFNRKPNNNNLCEVLYFEPDNVYTQDELEAALPELKTEPQKDHRAKKKGKAEAAHTCLTLVNANHSPEYRLFAEMVTAKLEEARYNADADKTQCRCIMPEHQDNNPSAVFFWGTKRYYCPSCETSLRIDQALEQAGGFEKALDYAGQHGLFPFADNQQDIIKKLGYGWQEYTENVRYLVEQITNVTDNVLLAPVALIGQGLDDKTRETAEVAAKETRYTLIRRNGSINESHAKDIDRISRLFAYPGQYGKIVVIAGQPGLAKTTLLKTFCKELIGKDPEAGMVLVYRTKKDMYENADYLNERADIDGNPIDDPEGLSYKSVAFVMQSWSPDPAICYNKKMRKYGRWFPGMCSNENCDDRDVCPLMKQYFAQKRYPVVIMTHERMLTDSEDYGKFFETYGTWEDYELKVHPRRMVIIDEKPDFVRETLIDHYTLTKLVNRITEVAEARSLKHDEDNSSVISEIEGVQRVVENIAKLQQGDEQQRVEFQSLLVDSVKIPFTEKLKTFARKHVGVEEHKLLVNIEYMFKAGYAYVTTHHGLEEGMDWQIGTSRLMPMNIRDMNVFILDGTADISADYADGRRFARYDCSDIRSYANWTIKWVNTSVSKQKLSDKAGEINGKIAQVVKREITPQHNKGVLVVTLKDNKDKLRRYFRGENDCNNVVVQYDGNLIGTNAYKDFTCIVFTSRIELPPVLYLAKQSLITGVARSNVNTLVAETFQFGKRWYYCDEFLEAVKLLSIAESMVQGILRIDRDPNSKEKVEVWVFDRNPLLLEVIRGKLTRCSATTVVLPEFTVHRKSASTYILAQTALEMLEACEDGRLSKAELRMKLGIGKRTLADSLIREDVRDDFAKLGMTIGNRYIEWAQ